jgi:hypothetical protein
MASTRTVLDVLEKVFDGVPVPGLKVVVGAVNEGMKALQVCEACTRPSTLSPFPQTSLENEEAISDVVKKVEDTQKALYDTITSSLDSSLVKSSEGNQRIAELSE